MIQEITLDEEIKRKTTKVLQIQPSPKVKFLIYILIYLLDT